MYVHLRDIVTHLNYFLFKCPSLSCLNSLSRPSANFSEVQVLVYEVP